jgi:tetratricopeptide (TPR) repeat protein
LAKISILSLFLIAISSFVVIDVPSASAKDKKAKADISYIHDYSIGSDAIEALTYGDIEDAIEALAAGQDNPKRNYLLNVTTKISSFEQQRKPSKGDAYETYMNAAINYHNLYLFLKSNGIEQEHYFKEAAKYYSKASKYATLIQKDECSLLFAAIEAASGNSKKAEKLFEGVDEQMMLSDYSSAEYLAAYHAATGNVEKASEALNHAFKLNPEGLISWLDVGDDFYMIMGDSGFNAFLATLKIRRAQNDITLEVPPPKKPALQMTDETGLFKAQKDMPKYKHKKKRKSGKSQPARKAKAQTKPQAQAKKH